MRIAGVDLVPTFKQVIKQVFQDDVLGLSAELAYRSFLALFPFFIFLATVSGFIAAALPVENPARTLLDLLGATLPGQLTSVLQPELESLLNSRDLGLSGLGFIFALLAATSGLNATMKALNRSYDVVESRSFWRRYALAAGLTVLAGTFLVIAFLLIVAGEVIGRQAAAAADAGTSFDILTRLARWPVALTLLFIASGFIYWAAPNRDLRIIWIVPGAIVYTLAWFGATLLFGWYVSNLGSYGVTYGTLAGAAVLLVWFYVTAFFFLLGAEINAVIDTQVDPEPKDERRWHQSAGPREIPALLRKW